MAKIMVTIKKTQAARKTSGTLQKRLYNQKIEARKKASAIAKQRKEQLAERLTLEQQKSLTHHPSIHLEEQTPHLSRQEAALKASAISAQRSAVEKSEASRKAAQTRMYDMNQAKLLGVSGPMSFQDAGRKGATARWGSK